ncbi:hypothetical protein F5882DRAFT_312916, partial [Hyaloscypha sp. PMI_1271]
ESINIYNNPRLNRPNTTITKIQVIKDILLQILVLFANTKSISKRYKIVIKASEDLSMFSISDIDLILITLNNKIKALVIYY